MAEYIDRYAAYNAIVNNSNVDAQLRDLDAIPAADVREVRWIPVTERLPEEDVLVLVWRYNGLPYVSRRTDSTYWLGLGRDSGITHWQPLPAPPKEETE